MKAPGSPWGFLLFAPAGPACRLLGLRPAFAMPRPFALCPFRCRRCRRCRRWRCPVAAPGRRKSRLRNAPQAFSPVVGGGRRGGGVPACNGWPCGADAAPVSAVAALGLLSQRSDVGLRGAACAKKPVAARRGVYRNDGIPAGRVDRRAAFLHNSGQLR